MGERLVCKETVLPRGNETLKFGIKEVYESQFSTAKRLRWPFVRANDERLTLETSSS